MTSLSDLALEVLERHHCEHGRAIAEALPTLPDHVARTVAALVVADAVDGTECDAAMSS